MLDRSGLAALACVLWATGAMAPAAAVRESDPRVEVVYVHPERFKDVGDRYYPRDAAKQAYLEDLERHIRTRASSRLADGQRLSVSITEVDMAGGFEPWRGRLGDTRIMRDVYPPRIDLTFTLTGADATVMRSGERKLRDLSFLGRPSVYRTGDALRYEKVLIDDWLERELAGSVSNTL